MLIVVEAMQYVGSGSVWVIHESSAQFCCEPKTTRKNTQLTLPLGYFPYGLHRWVENLTKLN